MLVPCRHVFFWEHPGKGHHAPRDRNSYSNDLFGDCVWPFADWNSRLLELCSYGWSSLALWIGPAVFNCWFRECHVDVILSMLLVRF